MASSASRSGGPSRSPRWHRWLRRVGIGGLSLVGLVLVLVLGALAYLATRPGESDFVSSSSRRRTPPSRGRSRFKSSLFAVGT